MERLEALKIQSRTAQFERESPGLRERFQIGGTTKVMLFNGTADRAIEWAVRWITVDDAQPRKTYRRCDCPACRAYRQKVMS